jgi:hypothetical protein
MPRLPSAPLRYAIVRSIRTENRTCTVIECMMVFCGGFLAASLLGVMLISVVHVRVVRLTHRRLEDDVPLSLIEMHADRDRLRADFAISNRRLEIIVEQLRTRSQSISAKSVETPKGFTGLDRSWQEKPQLLTNSQLKLSASPPKLRTTSMNMTGMTSKLCQPNRRCPRRKLTWNNAS